jgi:MFS family permease
MLAFFADIAPPGLEGVTMGLYRTFGGGGSLVGALVLGAVADMSGFAWSLGADAMLLTAAALGVVFIVKETAGRLGKPPPASPPDPLSISDGEGVAKPEVRPR